MKKIVLMLACVAIFTACGNTATECACKGEKCEKCMKAEKKFVSKYTNADFYKDGVFQEEVAKQAFIEMFEFYDYPITDYLKENWWFIDFGLGDFEHCGMGGVFWVNDPDYGYFAHDIYLLPNQMLPEHKHVPTNFPVKMESWMVRNGWAYNFSEVGEETPGWENIVPESQKSCLVSKHYVKQNVGDIIHLRNAGEQTWHFLVGGDQGAIVHEWARYHDGTGNRYTNTKAVM